jgi:hypothetical protein
MLAFSPRHLGQKGVLGVQESTMKALALWAREQHKAMCLLYIPHTEDFLVRYSRGLFLDSRMPHPPDKVRFKYRRLACSKGFLRITFSLLIEPNIK